MAIASECDEIFNFFDEDGSGDVTTGELKQAFTKIGATFVDKDFEAFVKKYDTNNNGILDKGEFDALIKTLNSSESTSRAVSRLFKKLDKASKKYLTKEELKVGLSEFTGHNANDAGIAELIRRLDVDGDGMVSYEEFTINVLARMVVAIKSI